MSDKQYRAAVAAEFGDQFARNSEGWHKAPIADIRRVCALHREAAERRALRQRCLAVAWKCVVLDETFDHDGSIAVEVAADLFPGIVSRGGDVAMAAMEFVQSVSPVLDPDELKAATDRVLDFLDGGFDV